jgi:hypothetical protein
MNFLIADTFTDSLARLTGDEQKAAKTTAFDLQMDPSAPGLNFHRLDRAKDKRFWSVRVNVDVRMIVHRTPESLLLCYVDHHDKAYAWAERRKLETHPKTGAAQLVEIRETVRDIVVPAFAAAQPVAMKMPPLFADLTDEQLLEYGVPTEWLSDARCADEDSVLSLAAHLPAEAAEALLELATGGKPRPPHPVVPTVDPFTHPDAQRRFRIMTSVEELQRALGAPWEKWTVFLHPEQRQWIERDYNGPARVSGSAGTGKTIVALHRAAHLARTNREARVLLATFSDPLARALHARLRCLIGNEPRVAERVDVSSLDTLALRLYRAQFGQVRLASREDIKRLLEERSAEGAPHKFSLRFLLVEWEHIVDAWQIQTWEAYRDVPRLGRRTRLPESQRLVLWSMFERVRGRLNELGLTTLAAIFGKLTGALADGRHAPFDFAVVDEAQDLSVAQMRFLAAVGGTRPNALFFAGDVGQRIFQQPFAWKSLGVDIRGRSRTLRVNYRTSHQIREQADRLLGPEITDADGNREIRNDTISIFNGPAPVTRTFDSKASEIDGVASWLEAQKMSGVQPDEIGIFVRSDAQLDRAKAAAEAASLPCRILDEQMETARRQASVSTMHLAKGLEFRSVAVMACDDEVIPLQARIEAVGDDADLQEVYDTERHLLYVACTRARDALCITSVEPASEFLDDLKER